MLLIAGAVTLFVEARAKVKQKSHHSWAWNKLKSAIMSCGLAISGKKETDLSAKQAADR